MPAKQKFLFIFISDSYEKKNDIFFHCQGINAEKAYLKRLTEKNRGCRKNMTFTKM